MHGENTEKEFYKFTIKFLVYNFFVLQSPTKNNAMKTDCLN